MTTGLHRHLKALSWSASVVAIAVALPCPEASAAPAIVVEERTWSFGSVPEGTRLTHSFTLRNAGDKPLVISGIRTICSCTQASLKRRELPSRQEESLSVVFNTQGFVGLVSHPVYLVTNDPAHPLYTLELRGVVEREVELLPAAVDFGEVPNGERAVREIHALVRRPFAVSQAHVTSTSPFLEARITPDEQAGFAVVIVLRSDAPIGKVDALLVLLVDRNSTNYHTIPVRATITGGIRVVPEHCFFGVVPINGQSVVDLSLSSPSDEPLSFEVLSVSDPRVSAELISSGTDRPVLRAVFRPVGDPDLVRGSIRLATGGPRRTEVDIRFVGMAVR